MKKAVNSFRVPVKQWRKWSATARTVFNRVYDFVLSNQPLMSHPKAEPVKPAHWKTASWNAAWIAADAVDDAIPTVVEDINLKTGATVKRRRVKSTTTS